MTLVMRKLRPRRHPLLRERSIPLVRRLKGVVAEQTPPETPPAQLDDDYESLDETAESKG